MLLIGTKPSGVILSDALTRRHLRRDTAAARRRLWAFSCDVAATDMAGVARSGSA
jgi:hypothetical protein